MEKVAVIGAGSWGTALALVLADNGHDVRLWGRRQEQINEINTIHTNEKYLPGVVLPAGIVGYNHLKEAVEGARTLLLVAPTKAMREVLRDLVPVLDEPVTLVHASKGIEPETYKRVSEIIEEEVPAEKRRSIVVLSGPSHAEEVSLRQPTTVTVSSSAIEEAEFVQDLFINQNFRVYTNPDIVGVELGGALKNIIALGAGMSDGLGYGDNAKAALITRGLAEIARLGTKMGANPLTFSGLTGIGDLIVTCTSVHSRNWRAGNMLGKGEALDDVLKKMGMVVEGVRTTKAAYQLAKQEKVEMPITSVLHDVLFDGKDAKEAVDELMKRSRTHEVEDVSSLISDGLAE
ncbi:NAD(P)H-dependent glycerol-3-phosphate dehydrogenase [Fictibacillus enclensis]|uniref:NAD(P)H-dependent glycerol-3-phosphate dehydrogenase n=1 Tax=Fictibacillus enclensis TaxID=1017270 RepID=UPI0024C04579|nr:NAD(P)H-dependent glycerol-3-phosphate dehydrogenase [Fictibacillus enclensis]MDM5199531.1 NAD(P)H-dependent glycerol-3-phosphate dehydrogenase [Fictibacillus enclensis]MDM5338768.1 NAD(P)H-dependent glycerol-3-phosphate dehydrogenase [Fictibacillus enclensis]WHY70265.1 NAD(P)H-dependent glycerol-3-phosphate dehydrogenase [Fictibacillus enclensis]